MTLNGMAKNESSLHGTVTQYFNLHNMNVIIIIDKDGFSEIKNRSLLSFSVTVLLVFFPGAPFQSEIFFSGNHAPVQPSGTYEFAGRTFVTPT